MSIQKYRAFLKVWELKSLTKAAEDLGYTQPSISHMISSLEHELGMALFIRTKTGIFPTENAKQLFPYFQQIISTEDALVETAYKIRGIEIGSLRVGAYLSISTQWLPSIVSDYLKNHPNIGLQFLIGTNEEICQWLLSGKIDIALTSDRIPNNYDFLPLYEDPILAVLHKDNPLASQEIIDLQDLVRFPLFVPYESSDRKIEAIMAFEHLKPNIRFRIKGGASTFAMINQGLGVTLTHKLSVFADIPAYSNIISLPIKQHYSRIIGICIQSYKHASPAELSFIEALQDFTKKESLLENQG